MAVELPESLQEEYSPDDYGIPWDDIAPSTDYDLGPANYPTQLRPPYVRGEVTDFDRMLREQAIADEAERAANTYGFLSRNVVEPWALTPENPLGPLGSAFRAVAPPVHEVTKTAGNVGVGLVSDIGAGGIQSGQFPLLNQALGGQRVSNIDETSGLGARIAEGAVRGGAEMVPALAAISAGVPVTAAFGGQMGLTELGESGDIKRAMTQAAVGAAMGPVGELGGAGGGLLGGRVAAILPQQLERATLGLSEMGGRQAFINALMTAGNAPGIVEAYMEDPAKGADMLAEQIGASLAFEAPHIPHMVREAFAREQGQRWLSDPNYLNQVDALTTRIAQPERPTRVDVPESLKALAEEEQTLGEPNAIQERQAETTVRGLPEQPGVNEPLPAEGGGGKVPQGNVPPGNAEGARATEEAGRRALPITEEHLAPAEEGKPEVAKLSTSRFKNPLTGDPMGTTYHATPADWAKWQEVQADFAKARSEGKGLEDMQEILKENERIKNKYGGMPPEAPKPGQEHLSPAERDIRTSRATPLDYNRFVKADEAGTPVVDVDKLINDIDRGEIKGTHPGSLALLKELLQPSEKHPLKGIKIIDLTPNELKALTGGQVAFKGRFALRRNDPTGLIEILAKDQQGNPITHAEFVQTLAHELEHNAVTSKLPHASEELQAEVKQAYEHIQEMAKGTVFEKHNTLLNEHEFLAEARTDPQIKAWLETVPKPGATGPVTKANSMWGKLLELVQKVLKLPDFLTGADGKKVKTLTVLDEVNRFATELKEVQRQGEEGPRPAEERLRPEEEKPGGLPIRPRAGEAGAINFSMVQPAITRAMDWVGEVPTKVKVSQAQLAGKAAPATSVHSVEAGNALVRYASAKIAAPEVAKYMATEVLGSHYQDKDFANKLGAVLVEDRLRAIQDAFQKAGSTNLVTTIIGKPDSPLQSEADFTAALADPEIQAAIARHKASVEKVARSAHKGTGGELAGHGLNTGAFVNLKAIMPEAEFIGGGGRGNLQNPLRRRSKFARQASGTAANYEIDYRTIAERMIAGNFEEVAKRKMYSQLVKDGLAQLLNPGDNGGAAPEIGGKPAVKFQIERKGVPAGGGKARTFVKNLWVRADIAPEVRQALDVDGKIQSAALVNVAKALNWIQLQGPTDAVWHTANMVASIAGSQGGKNVLADMARQLPGVNIGDALTRIVASSIKVFRNTPEIQKQIADLARIGAGRRREEPSKLTPLNLMHKTIRLVDQAGRLVRDDMYQNLVRRGLVRDTEANRREWINQMGQYNPRLMGQFQRFFKEAGFSPFIVAGRNFNRMAARRLTMDPGIEAVSPAAAAQMRAVNAFGTIATLFAVPALANYLLTGKPQGRDGTKIGQIDTSRDDKDGNHIVIDPAQWIGLRRGLRNYGIQAVIEGLRQGKRGKKIAQEAVRDILGGMIHPWSGPAVSTLSIASTGYTPSMYKESENPQDYGENFYAAVKQLNPVVEALWKGKEEETGMAKELGKSLAGAAGYKTVVPFTAKSRMANLHSKWLANNPDPKVKADFERNEAATFPVSKYKDLDKALRSFNRDATLKAIQELRPLVKEDNDIYKRMEPYINQDTLSEDTKPLFHESADLESKFRQSLDADGKALYRQALKERQAQYKFFLEVWPQRGPKKPIPSP